MNSAYFFSLSKSLLVIALIVLNKIDAVSQQKVQFTQYMFNRLMINPACAGMDEALSLTFINRSQWQGLEGAPTTQTLAAHTLFKNRHLGVGLSVANDKIGIHKNFSAFGSSAYHIKVADHSYLSMGIRFGVNHKNSGYISLAGASLDPQLYDANISGTNANFGFGVYYRSPKFEAGFSVPELIPEKFIYNDTLTIQLSTAHYFLFSKYSYPLNENLDLEPSVLLKYLPGIPLSFDVNANIVVKKVLTLGLSYRKSESFDFLFLARITPQLRIGYAYDYGIGKIKILGGGSHELMVSYVFKFVESEIASPR